MKEKAIYELFLAFRRKAKNQVLSIIHLNLISNFQAVNADGVLVSGADNGTMYFWDWKTGYNFQRLQVTK